MAFGVLNSLSAIYAENNLNNTSSSLQRQQPAEAAACRGSSLQTVLQQLSSGSRVNSWADDAAGPSLVTPNPRLVTPQSLDP